MKGINLLSVAVLAFIILFLFGCSKQPIIGGETDSHGCIGSAGYSWCDAKQKCLKTWEEPCQITDVAVSFCNKDNVVRVWVCDDYAKVESASTGGGVTYYDISKTAIQCPIVGSDSVTGQCKQLSTLECTEVPCQ
jgi:hypothetical protein